MVRTLVAPAGGPVGRRLLGREVGEGRDDGVLVADGALGAETVGDAGGQEGDVYVGGVAGELAGGDVPLMTGMAVPAGPRSMVECGAGRGCLPAAL
ncbi:hypothetical protein A6A29_25250 [Streptomyces sp. TSRI0281]|nr:hypothetical protein A6A29_25250 [Streptomyces sp. TSRI0281]